jgi:hypothetical protein
MFLKSFKKDLVDILTYFTGDFFFKEKRKKENIEWHEGPLSMVLYAHKS